jgi:predicted RNase H-like HicB family nuclease
MEETVPMRIVLIEDEEIGGYISYFEDFPCIIAEGETTREAVKNLIELAEVVASHLETYQTL